jgi:hypothetical protein
VVRYSLLARGVRAGCFDFFDYEKRSAALVSKAAPWCSFVVLDLLPREVSAHQCRTYYCAMLRLKRRLSCLVEGPGLFV